MLETNGNCQKTALETIKYEAHGRGATGAPHPPQPPMLQKNLEQAEG